MRLGHQPAQIQPQPHASAAALAGAVGAVEGLCQMRQLCFRHAVAIVAHFQHHISSVAVRNRHGRRRVRRAVPQRIVQQVAQQQLHAGTVQIE